MDVSCLSNTLAQCLQWSSPGINLRSSSIRYKFLKMEVCLNGAGCCADHLQNGDQLFWRARLVPLFALVPSSPTPQTVARRFGRRFASTAPRSSSPSGVRSPVGGRSKPSAPRSEPQPSGQLKTSRSSDPLAVPPNPVCERTRFSSTPVQNSKRVTGGCSDLSGRGFRLRSVVVTTELFSWIGRDRRFERRNDKQSGHKC